MMKRLFSLLLLLTLLSALPMTAFAESAEGTSGNAFVEDAADFFTAEEEWQLEMALLQAAESTDGDCAFYLATHKMPTRYSPRYEGEDFLKKHGLSNQNSIVILIITLDDGVYYYDMYTYGDAYAKLSDKEVNYILDHKSVYNDMKSGALLNGATSFFTLAAKGYNGRVGTSYLLIGTISLCIALLIGVACCAGVYSSYTKRKKSVDYPLEHFAKLELTENSDVFVGSFVTKRVIQSGNEGGSGGGGHSGHGGGGGHRGGR